MIDDQIRLHNVRPEEFIHQDALHQQFVSIFPDYADIFPSVRDEIQHGTDQNNRFLPHYWLIQKEDLAIGIALSRYLIQSNIGFFRYLGVDPAHRQNGIGTMTIHELKKQFCKDARNNAKPEPWGYCFEVEDPTKSHNEKYRRIDQQRLDYFKNRGAFVLPVDYFEPILDVRENTNGANPKAMLLMFQPIDSNRKSVDLPTTQKFVKAVWTEHYGLSGDDPVLQSILKSITKRR